ncbi:recombinase RecJ [Sporanaerobium hydrogeniformans]|uniref:Recombinase RecJ n=1 Tax=Sporanaerobium hydrogeniformans TaxID=3072179 RepID=A0AC61DCK4_9FIRM|nr:DHH family phosphoesterase [Sporanaerobium hydrogeniformans]PHV70950.1 recombinase RecJ [Sporanaerobium hydrogeniformans]
MKLSQLTKYQDIVIQCHDNPDPDTIGAGYALYKYFEEQGKRVRLVYGGHLKITKPNVCLMVEKLDIPLEHVQNLEIKELLITVDCQYGAGNVTRFEAPYVVVIDHHEEESREFDAKEIRQGLASTCTVVWQMFVEEGIDINKWYTVATALYYGLFTDSAGFSEVRHPFDKDMRDELRVDEALIRQLKNAVLTLSELEIAGMALIRHSYNVANKFVVVKAQECDPNILGFISDLAIQVDSVNVCLVYNQTIHGIKFSVRSCVKEVMANELANYLCDEMGSGGGNLDKAGGFINNKEFNEKNAHLNADEFFLRRLTNYYKSFEVIDAMDTIIDVSTFKTYKGEPVCTGMVPLCEVFPLNTTVCVRTIEGDIDLEITPNLYMLIGLRGEIRPITKEKFEENYVRLDEDLDLDFSYFPNARNKQGKVTFPLKEHTYKCRTKGESYVFAKALTKGAKLFTWWDRQRYIYGKPGDYLIVIKDNLRDIDIINKEVFEKRYKIYLDR